MDNKQFQLLLYWKIKLIRFDATPSRQIPATKNNGTVMNYNFT